MPATPATSESKRQRRAKFWRRLFRFDLGTLVCFIIALNLVVYANWQLRDGYRVALNTVQENHVVLRAKYEVGWPWHFLQLNGLQNRLPTHTDADGDPVVEILSWSAAAKSLLVNAGILLVLTATLLWLKTAIFSEIRPRAHGQRTMKKIPPDFV